MINFKLIVSKNEINKNKIKKQGNLASFCNLDSALNNGNLKSELKTQIKTHLFDLKKNLSNTFLT